MVLNFIFMRNGEFKTLRIADIVQTQLSAVCKSPVGRCVGRLYIGLRLADVSACHRRAICQRVSAGSARDLQSPSSPARQTRQIMHRNYTVQVPGGCGARFCRIAASISRQHSWAVGGDVFRSMGRPGSRCAEPTQECVTVIVFASFLSYRNYCWAI